MNTFLKKISNKFKETHGASMLEYALLASLISVAVLLAVSALGEQANTTLERVAVEMGGGNFHNSNSQR